MCRKKNEARLKSKRGETEKKENKEKEKKKEKKKEKVLELSKIRSERRLAP